MNNRTLYILAALFFLCAGVLVFWGVKTDASFGGNGSWNALDFALSTAVLCALTIISAMIYFFPTIHAQSRQHRERKAIFLLNLFLGWTLLGWVAALVWSFTTANQQPTTHNPQ